LRANRGDHVALIASGVAVQVHERLGVWQAGSIPDFHFRKVLQNASSDEALGLPEPRLPERVNLYRI
jgi:hypothetical protein